LEAEIEEDTIMRGQDHGRGGPEPTSDKLMTDFLSHSEDYTSVVDSYHWYDESGRLLRTDISRFRLLDSRRDGRADGDKGAEVQ
jgi:hypothetical protein